MALIITTQLSDNYFYSISLILRPVCVLVQSANLWLHQFLTLWLWSSQHSCPIFTSI